MSNWDVLGPRVTITRALDGTSRTLPLEEVDGNYLDIAQSPDEGFPPPLAIGSPEQRTDLRTRQHISRDWRRGMGEDEYDETQGATSFRRSRADTRFKNVLVCRPLPVRLGGSTTLDTITPGTQIVTRVAYVGSTARWFAYSNDLNPYYFRESDDTWVSLDASFGGGTLVFHQGSGGMFYVHGVYSDLSHSTNGATWTAVDIADITAAIGIHQFFGVTTHDSKVFLLARDNTYDTTHVLFQSTDAHTAPASANWTQLGTVVLGAGELPTGLFTWKFPPQPERGGVFMQTTRRLFWYDDTADAASTTAWKEWHDFRVVLQDTAFRAFPFALTWPRTLDLYVFPASSQDSLYQFTGSSVATHGPNKRGGLPPTEQHTFGWAQANSHSLVAWLRGSTQVGSGNTGLVAALNESEGWHHVFAPDATSVSGFPASQSIIGGGLGPDSVLTVLSNGQVWEQAFFDSASLPQYATTARSYDPTPLIHDTAKMDIGSPTIPKAALYHEMNAKIPDGASVAVAYRLDDSDQTGAWTTLGTATSATAMPWRVGFANGTTFRQAELRYTLTRGTATSATPIVYSGILHATLLPPARFNTVFRVDLRAEKFRNGDRTIDGYGLEELRTWVRGCHGQIVAFEVTHPGGVLAVTRGQAAVTPTEHPLDGLGRYTFQIRDLTTPSSG